MQTTITEIAPNVFRLSTFVSDFDMQFNQFLVRDEEPLLWHTGLRAHFPLVRDAVATLIPIERLRWIGFSHFEADECGSLADWQRLAPHSTALASIVAKVVSVDDSAALRPAHGLSDDEIFTTGAYRFRFLQTPHVPHTWEAGMLFEETRATLFCSDLFHHNGNVVPTTSSDVVDLFRQKLTQDQQGPFAFYLPWTTVGAAGKPKRAAQCRDSSHNASDGGGTAALRASDHSRPRPDSG